MMSEMGGEGMGGKVERQVQKRGKCQSWNEQLEINIIRSSSAKAGNSSRAKGKCKTFLAGAHRFIQLKEANSNPHYCNP